MPATRPIGWTADDVHDFLQMHFVPQALPDWQIRIQLSVRTSTGWRIPDLAALRSGTRATRSSTRRPAGIGLVVEVVSPSSRRRDRVVKREQYPDVGIRTNGWSTRNPI